jgi:pimeloyl-ACP methyl ester carboxylesterase
MHIQLVLVQLALERRHALAKGVDFGGLGVAHRGNLSIALRRRSIDTFVSLARRRVAVLLAGMVTHLRKITVEGISIAYREAGPEDAHTLLLLHGFPSSSRMFEPLFARLADRFHLVAPDYPGFGHSDWPDPRQFEYTFDRIAAVMARFAEALGLRHYSLYMQDYGGPVGLRMALANPGNIAGLIVQNAVAHSEGLGDNWAIRRAFWAERERYEAALRTNLLSFETTRARHVGTDPDVGRYDPDLWNSEFAFLQEPGQIEIQLALFYDYRRNVESYPRWQAWLREQQPPLLVLWGIFDPSFRLSEPQAYLHDVPGAEVALLDGGHFALDTAADDIADRVARFLMTIQNRAEKLTP